MLKNPTNHYKKHKIEEVEEIDEIMSIETNTKQWQRKAFEG